MIIFSPPVAYWVGFTTICVLLLIFALRLLLPWAARHKLTSLVVSPQADADERKSPRRLVQYVHGENKRGAQEPVKSASSKYRTASHV
jgi:hypothetical protein